MSSCSRQYASRYINELKKARGSTSLSSSPSPRVSQPQPLLFLYPSWFQQTWHHQYHTDREPGRGQSSRDSKSTKSVSRNQAQSGRNSHPPVQRFAPPHVDPLKPSLVRKVVSSKAEQQHFRRKIDFHKVVSLLSEALDANEPVVKDEHNFVISRQHAFALTGHFSCDAWIHHEDTGCVVKVKPNTNDTRYTVSLEGSERARTLAREYVNSVRDEKWFWRHVKSRTEWANSVSTFPATADIRDLPEPPQWSNRTFFRFVTALTQARQCHGVNRYTYGGRASRNSHVATMLESLFSDPVAAPFASSGSVEQALMFCRRHTELAASAGRIWSAAKSLGIPFSVRCYNEELGRCLITNDNHRFMDTITTMRNDGIPSNNDTWALALQYADTAESRFDIVREYLDAGKIKMSDDTQMVVAALVKGELTRFLHHPNGLVDFMKEMDATMGPAWLTTRILDIMLRICRIIDGRVNATSQLLAETAKRQTTALDRASLVELIRIAKKAGNLQNALEVLQCHTPQVELDLHQVVLEPLFQLAWRRRSLNLCRLLWKFACSKGRTTFVMKDILWHSLQGNTDQSADETTKNWQRYAGKLIVGQGLDINHVKKAVPHLFADEKLSSILSAQSAWANSTSRYEQLQLSQFLLERDMNAWRFNYPMSLVNMRQLLSEAFDRDVQLEAKNFWHKTTDIEEIETFAKSLPEILLAPRSQPIEHPERQRESFMFNDNAVDYDTLELPETIKSSLQNLQEHEDVQGPQTTEPSVFWPTSFTDTPPLVMQPEPLNESEPNKNDDGRCSDVVYEGGDQRDYGMGQSNDVSQSGTVIEEDDHRLVSAHS